MEFSEDDEPSAVFLDLSAEIFELGLPESEPVPVAGEKSLSVPLPEEVSERISDDRPDDREDDKWYKVCLPEESAHEEHDLLSGHEHADDREGLDDAAHERDDVVPCAERVDLFLHPLDEELDPARAEYRDRGQDDHDRAEDEIQKPDEESRDVADDFFVHFEGGVDYEWGTSRSSK